MWRVIAGVALTMLCTTVGAVGYAQPDIKVDKFCSRVTVDGVAGQIWRVTENGVATWVILDSERDFLAKAPERCVLMLSATLERQKNQAPPSIQSISSSRRLAQTSIAPLDSDEDQRAGIVAAHNDVRRSVGIKEDMQWSARLAAYAQEWADVLKNERSCAIAHRPLKGKYARKYGENLSWVRGRTQSGAQAVQAWASEKGDYDYATGNCDKVCGHYTQKWTPKLGPPLK